MKIDNFLQFLVPKDKKFFPLFEQAAENAVEVSKVLVEAVTTSSLEKRKELIKKIEELEHKGDKITHSIFYELNSTFITPLDREDIHLLAKSLDDIVDYINGAAMRILLYKIVEIPAPMVKLAELTLKSAEGIRIAVKELKDVKHPSKIKEACIMINSTENHADDIFENALADLFENEKNPVNIIKQKEILSALETATDKCEDVANVLEGIIVKTA
jgi:uncharacterized protein